MEKILIIICYDKGYELGFTTKQNWGYPQNNLVCYENN